MSEGMLRCRSCGRENFEGTAICVGCDQPLEDAFVVAPTEPSGAVAEPAVPSYAPPAPTGELAADAAVPPPPLIERPDLITRITPASVATPGVVSPQLAAAHLVEPEAEGAEPAQAVPFIPKPGATKAELLHQLKQELAQQVMSDKLSIREARAYARQRRAELGLGRQPRIGLIFLAFVLICGVGAYFAFFQASEEPKVPSLCEQLQMFCPP